MIELVIELVPLAKGSREAPVNSRGLLKLNGRSPLPVRDIGSCEARQATLTLSALPRSVQLDRKLCKLSEQELDLKHARPCGGRLAVL